MPHLAAEQRPRRLVRRQRCRSCLVQPCLLVRDRRAEHGPTTQPAQPAAKVDEGGGVGQLAHHPRTGTQWIQQRAGQRPPFLRRQWRGHRGCGVSCHRHEFAQSAAFRRPVMVGKLHKSALARHDLQRPAALLLRRLPGAEPRLCDQLEQPGRLTQRPCGVGDIGGSGGQVRPCARGDVIKEFRQRCHGVASARPARRR
jgi:hypothetical protein